MSRRIWMLDLAREQSPTREHLLHYCEFAKSAGYDAIGLYLEHRFAFQCAPWAHGVGSITADDIRWLQDSTEIQIIPFINLLGHFEGFIYTEEGKQYRAELLKGLQACASKPEFVSLCRAMVQETLDVFTSDEIHIGGDETAQLDANDLDKARIEASDSEDGKAMIYSEHFRPLAEMVIEAGRTPAMWADMFADHPTILDQLPKETILYDWKYFESCRESAQPLLDKGFRVVACPALHLYNAAWMHIKESEENVRTLAKDAQEMGLYGVCQTSWEHSMFSSIEATLPAVAASAAIMDDPDGAPSFLDSYEAAGEQEWAQLMGCDLPALGGPFKFSGIRSGLRCRMLLYSNPFLAWMHHAEDLCGPIGSEALRICAEAMEAAKTDEQKKICVFTRSAIEFVRFAEKARIAYAAGHPEEAVRALAPSRYLFDTLAKLAKRSQEETGGSLADEQRCLKAKAHVETVIQNIRKCGNGELGYLPAFEIITNPRFMPHDQGCWWLINKWANE
jgi:hypothetical protein